MAHLNCSKIPTGDGSEQGAESKYAPGVARDTVDRWSDLGKFIREQRNVARLSLRRLSELSGISNPYLSQIERGLRKPSADILQQIARALHISAETLYVQAGILDRSSAGGDLVRHIEADPFLSPEHKLTLIRIYSSFRQEQDRARPAPHQAPHQAPDAPEAPEADLPDG